MQKRSSIVNVPLLVGAVLSIAIHVAALYSKGIYTPPAPKMDAGRTVVQLTLVPSVASTAAAPEPQPKDPEPVDPVPPETPAPIETVPEPIPTPVQEPIPEPVPEPAPAPPAPAVAETASADSPELDASLIADKGVVSEAEASVSINPAYPRISRRRGEEGIVILSVEVLASGKAGNVEVLQSSGHKRLDDAARKAVQKASFAPATQYGRNIDSETQLSFTFRLTND